MKFYIKIPETLKPFFQKELNDFQMQMQLKNFHLAWNHLERAHIIGQKYPFSHNLVHWEMLKFGFIIKDVKEIAGQIPRLVFGGVKSFVGKVPTGNPGGANVPPLKKFPIQKEILEIFRTAGI